MLRVNSQLAHQRGCWDCNNARTGGRDEQWQKQGRFRPFLRHHHAGQRYDFRPTEMKAYAKESPRSAKDPVSVKRACQWVASESGINVRRGPGTRFRSVGVLRAGDHVGTADPNGTCKIVLGLLLAVWVTAASGWNQTGAKPRGARGTRGKYEGRRFWTFAPIGPSPCFSCSQWLLHSTHYWDSL